VSDYRVFLTREALPIGGECEGLFVMLNPSTAGEVVDDPTIRRCTGFAKQFRWTRYTVVNLFSARATDPAELLAMKDPVGPDGAVALDAALSRFPAPVAAWGAVDARLAWRVAEVLKEHPSVAWRWLGTTKAGAPRHPLFVPAAQGLVTWDAAAWLAARGTT
jgi:hypothetical protein